VALCDVDLRQTGKAYEKFPKARHYRDFRKMLDEVEGRIDAVVVATPDHTHAVACMAAIQRGKHVYCEKPLAHSVREIRRLRQAAHDNKVITQVGNQGHSSDSIRTFCEWIWDGAIGKVTEVHACCDAFPEIYCQIDKLPSLSEKHDVPSELDWDLWLGPALQRTYHPVYAPWSWRGWLPFGTGCIGDWICHVVDPAYWALDLGAPTSIHAEVEGYDPVKHADLYPRGTQVTYQFPAKGDRGPVKLVWYDGVKKPPRPADLEEGRNPPGTGAIVIGDKGTITHGSHGAGGVRIIPEAKMQAYKRPEPTIPRVPGHHQDWLQAIREGRQAGSNFDYGGSLAELGLLGVIAIKFPGTRLDWDAEQTRFTNCDEANQYVHPPYRQGWSL
jgi:predicted dehydrogenase